MNCQISVIIPSIGRSEYVHQLVDLISVNSLNKIEVILVHSGELEIKKSSSDVRYVRSFPLLLAGAARNLGATFATGKYLLFIDDDNISGPDLPLRLMDILEHRPEIVLIGPTIYYMDAPTEIQCSGVIHKRMLGRTSWLQTAVDESVELRVCDAVPNSYMVRRSQFEAVGGFDEISFPMEFEESDLALRLRSKFGGRVAVTNRASIFHSTAHNSARAMSPKSSKRAFYLARNRYLFYERHFSFASWLSWVAVGAPISAIAYCSSLITQRNVTIKYKVIGTYNILKGHAYGLAMSGHRILRRILKRFHQ